MAEPDDSRDAGAGQLDTTPNSPFTVPSISPPKGGGAIRGIGEKFSVSAATGTGQLTIPLPASPGRDGPGPALALAYDSGAGQGPFGLGWSLGLPAITRKTDRGVPRYADDEASDVFILSGSDDLVPLPGSVPRTVDGTAYSIVRYRPRVEGLQGRIERWTDLDRGTTHWRSISRDNVTTLYGTSDNSRIADPADRERRVFSWLIAESTDALGHAVSYQYEEENGEQVDTAAVHERGRARTANRYLKSVRYCNVISRLAGSDDRWHFELVLDYGDHDENAPMPSADAGRTRSCRADPFSSYRSGFEIRTYRLCRRILMFHHFPGEKDVGEHCLVRTMRLRYRGDADRGHAAGSFLASVELSGHRRDPAGGYLPPQSMPPLELTYSTAERSQAVHDLAPGSLENVPEGIAGDSTWIDLDAESISGVLSEHAGAWYYKPNLGDGRLGPVQALPRQPSLPLGDGSARLLDLAGDGALDLAAFDGPLAGFFERTDEREWAQHRRFASLPAFDWTDANVQLVDLSGDGLADALVTTADSLIWYPSKGEEGFGPPVRVPLPSDEELGPRVVLADDAQSVHLADMSGDGLTDLVRIRNGEVCYWPSLGHGRFGAKVVMDGSPWFDRADAFDQRRLRLADLDGSGPTDIVYLGAAGADLYLNRMGNAWSAPERVAAFPSVDDVATVRVVDLLGRGTACLVWSSPLAGAAGRHVRYVDLMGVKPHLLVGMSNNLGAETAVTYTTSTAFYLADKAAGRPWITRLPFPVHVIEQVETFDWINKNRFVTRYAYHHGHFDGHEREFRGFGLVEQRDTDHIAALRRSTVFPTGVNVDPATHMPPVLTRTWFHTGAAAGRDRLSALLAREYYPEPSWRLEDTPLPDGLSPEDEREACRALNGQMLRQEVYALDGTDREPHPYTVVERNLTVERLQPSTERDHGVFAVHPRESLSVSCERDPTDPRVAQELVLAVDPFGTPTHTISIAYGRAEADTDLPLRTRAVQATTLVTEIRTEMTTPVTGDDAHRVPVPHDVTTFQLGGPALDTVQPLLDREWARQSLTGTPPQGVVRRVLARERTRFHDDELAGPLAWGALGARGLVHETYQLVFTPNLLTEAYGSRVTATMLTAAGYVQLDGAWWAPSGTVRYAPAGVAGEPAFARAHFFLPRRFADPFGNETSVEYDDYDLLPVEVVDAVGNRTTAAERSVDDERLALHLDYRVLAPDLITDANRNRIAIRFDSLGLVAATAAMGKVEDGTGDRVDEVDADLPPATVAALWADPHSAAAELLSHATVRYVHDLHAYRRTRAADDPEPAGLCVIAREQHVTVAPDGPLQVSFTYSDGLGRQAQEKLPAEPASAGAPPRWIGSGWEVLDNKGRSVRRYEPFFTSEHAFEFAVLAGVSTIKCHDALGRLIATVHPSRTYDKVVFGPWHKETWDVNDTATLENPADDIHVGALIGRLDVSEYQPTWYAARITGGAGAHEKAAAQLVELHGDTPTLAALDPLARPIFTRSLNRTPGVESAPAVESERRTYVALDIQGNERELLDCPDGTPGLVTAGADRTVTRTAYDLIGTRIREDSMEAGTRRLLVDAAGKALFTWEPDGTGAAERRTGVRYDQLGRPTAMLLTEQGAERTIARTEYGEAAADASTRNARGRIGTTHDGAGQVTYAYDVDGNARLTTRRFTRAYRGTIDWAAGPALEPRAWTTVAEFDALNRMTVESHPDGTSVRFGYNAAGLLETVVAELPGDAAPTPFVTGSAYNAKGQRTALALGNGVVTTYRYEPDTFRLHQVESEPGLQKLTYVYDPAGNLIRATDEAQTQAFHLNTQVDASADYVYDALHQLVEVHAREHAGPALQSPTSWNGGERVDPVDPNALRRYRERYTYDVAGNLTALAHHCSQPGAGWTRSFRYDAPSQLEASRKSNRLTATRDGATQPELPYAYDACGNLTAATSLQVAGWNHDNQLVRSSRQAVSSGLPETTYYAYDGNGDRVRKVTDRAAPSAAAAQALSERLYVGSFELYREFAPSGDVALARGTVHLHTGGHRIAMVETRLDVAGDRLIRYQLADQLGSSTVEVDETAAFVSYEEYYAYGGTALSFTRGAVPPKRYRHLGKEHDEETGLVYHGARYFSPWLARWTSCDPQRAVNAYTYCRNSPRVFADPDGRAPACVGKQHCYYDGDPNGDFIQLNREMETDFGLGWVYDPEARAAAADVEDEIAEENYARRASTAQKAKDWLADRTQAAWSAVTSSRPVRAAGELDESLKETMGNVGAEEFDDTFGGLQRLQASRLGAPADFYVTAPEIGRAWTEWGYVQGRDFFVSKAIGVAGPAVKAAAVPAQAVAVGLGAQAVAVMRTIAGQKARSWAANVLIGVSKQQFRRAALRIINGNPGHPLRRLLTPAKKFKQSTAAGVTGFDWFMDASYVEAGHAVSDRAGGPEYLVLMTARRNRSLSGGIEHASKGGAHQQSIEALDIGGIAVEIESAREMLRAKLLDQADFDNAPRLFFNF